VWTWRHHRLCRGQYPASRLTSIHKHLGLSDLTMMVDRFLYACMHHPVMPSRSSSSSSSSPSSTCARGGRGSCRERVGLARDAEELDGAPGHPLRLLRHGERDSGMEEGSVDHDNHDTDGDSITSTRIRTVMMMRTVMMTMMMPMMMIKVDGPGRWRATTSSRST
jgi:hypothetical protein